MEKMLEKHLGIIENSISWINASLEGNKQRDAYRKLVNHRRKLRKKNEALEGNPAAALYGESQAGKSYLISALLSEKGETFKVVDAKGNQYDFKNQINPRGNEVESTSLVTRFSTKYKFENDDYPIIAKLLSPVDLVLVICEAYYHNLNVNKTLSFDALKEKIESFEKVYLNKAKCQALMIGDDILDIEEYFHDNFSQLVYNNIKDANFFEKLAGFIENVPPSEWKDVISLFWNFTPQLTKLFNDLVEQYSKLDFTGTIFLPMEAVLREKGTLLDVVRLDEIYGEYRGPNSEHEPNTKIYWKNREGAAQTITFPKSYLCALISEIIFVLPDKLKGGKEFLSHTDLLDFPGARRYDSTNEDNITEEDVTVLLRRGKVDYLFNKYSNNERINTLLFCQNHKQSNQSVMPERLNRWIGNMIGKTAEERENFKSSVPPLFVISTWFNKDLFFDRNNDRPGNINSLTEKWNQRFTRVLKGEIFKSGVNNFNWLSDWTISNRNFQNIFLLRDFDKSEDDQIFRGFSEFKEEREEIKPESYPSFREDLKKSFVEHEFVRSHFSHPEESWDAAAGMNKDGTGLIIDKLTIASNQINSARREKTISELNEILNEGINLLVKYFHTDDKDIELQKAKSTAGSIQFELDSTFSGEDIRHFGPLMKELMIDESKVLEHYRKTMDNIEHRDIVILDKYFPYRQRVPVLADDTADSYFDRLCASYEKTTDEEKQNFRKELDTRGIDLDELVSIGGYLIKNSAQQLADSLLDYWSTHITLNDRQMIQTILVKEGKSYLQDIGEMYQKLFKKINFSERIAEKIRRYVDAPNKTEVPYEMVADISAELLNKCISTVGFEFFDTSEINDLQKANEENKLGLELNFDTEQTKPSIEETFIRIENWVDIIQTNPQELKSLPGYRNYLEWYHRLKAGFVYVCDIPNYDMAANDKLGRIIEQSKTINYV